MHSQRIEAFKSDLVIRESQIRALLICCLLSCVMQSCAHGPQVRTLSGSWRRCFLPEPSHRQSRHRIEVFEQRKKAGSEQSASHPSPCRCISFRWRCFCA